MFGPWGGCRCGICSRGGRLLEFSDEGLLKQTKPGFAAVDVEIGVQSSVSRSSGLAGRRPLQALALVLVTAYATVLLYQAVAPRQASYLLLTCFLLSACDLIEPTALCPSV